MNITIKELLDGFPCLIKNKEFFSPKIYVEPFLERMSQFTNDFRVQVKLADTLSTKEQNLNNVYTRVLIESVLPEKYSIDKHDEVIGLVYGIDVRKPVVSFYKGYLNSACLNLTIFNPSWVSHQELIPSEPINYSPLKQIVESTNDFSIKLKKLKNTFIDREDRQLELGKWVDNSIKSFLDLGFGKIKLSTATSIEAYTNLFVDKDSPYFIPESQDPSLFDIYNSFTQVITHDKKDIIQKANKVLLLNQILNLSFN